MEPAPSANMCFPLYTWLGPGHMTHTPLYSAISPACLICRVRISLHSRLTIWGKPSLSGDCVDDDDNGNMRLGWDLDLSKYASIVCRQKGSPHKGRNEVGRGGKWVVSQEWTYAGSVVQYLRHMWDVRHDGWIMWGYAYLPLYVVGKLVLK